MTSILTYTFVAKTLKILNMGLWASKLGPRAPKQTKNRDFELPKLLKITIFTPQNPEKMELQHVFFLLRECIVISMLKVVAHR